MSLPVSTHGTCKAYQQSADLTGTDGILESSLPIGRDVQTAGSVYRAELFEERVVTVKGFELGVNI